MMTHQIWDMIETSVEALNTDSANPLQYEEKVNQLGLDFSLERIITEEARPLYAVTFCDILPEYSSYFASVGGNSVKIYKILDDHIVELVYGFLDEDVEEIFYCCTWCATAEGMDLCDTLSLQKSCCYSQLYYLTVKYRDFEDAI